MTNSIVSVNVTQQVAPTPNTVQKQGALISQGATTMAPGDRALLTQLSDLTDLLRDALPLASLAWASGSVTATTPAPHGLTVGGTLSITIAGAVPTAYNGTYDCTITGASAFIFAKASNPGTETSPGTYILGDVAELLSMATTFFAQGSQQAVYVLELGAVSDAAAIAALSTYIAASRQFFYSYLVPRSWANDAAYLAFVAGFEATTSRTYFWTTVTASNYTNFTALMKCVIAMIESPDKPATEFSLAAAFFVALNYDPSSTNKVTPFAFSYLFGVTAYPEQGNSSLLSTLKAAFINYVGTGAEGGITNTVLFWGTTKDGRDFTYWYSVDWVQITGSQSIANAVLNGSNNPANPLYYNQDGINRLQSKLAATMADGVAFGLVLGPPVQTNYGSSQLPAAIDDGVFDGQTGVNAVGFIPYTRENPTHYAAGIYNGLTVIYTPARGFTSITFNVLVTDFVTQ